MVLVAVLGGQLVGSAVRTDRRSVAGDLLAIATAMTGFIVLTRLTGKEAAGAAGR